VIVISGALVLVALVLLIIGVVGPDLTFVYASIAVSLVSLVFLVIGILQRRGETAPAVASTPATEPARDEDPADSVTAVIPAQGPRGGSRKVVEEAPVAETADEELDSGGIVLVVEGRPRYHVDGCRYLSGKDVEEVDVLDARDEGFTPCGVCKPDENLSETFEEEFEEETVEEPVVEQDVPGVEVPPTRAKAPAKKAAKKAPATATTKAPTKAATKAATKAPATRAATATSTKAPSKAPSKAATAAAAASPAAAASAKKAGSVVVIPDRGKFHRGECRYVRDVDGAEVLTKSAARRQGYAACGVCKP
jgi:hypothetical protein